MRLPFAALVTLLILIPGPTFAQVTLDKAAEAELKQLCKTRLKPAETVDWDDFCSCMVVTIENDFSRAQYVTWRNALVGTAKFPGDPVYRKMWSSCIEAMTSLQPGTEIRLPNLPPKSK